MKNQSKINPRKVRAALCLRGISLTQWSKRNGYPVSTVSMVMHGNRHGPQSQKILRKLKRLI